jgi:putative membrane-bound dehydrogenase-like protein
MIIRLGFWVCGLVLLPWTVLGAAPPKTVDPRLVLELVAREPDIVTPTGLAVDDQGRIWVIENHTHQRPEKYAGPPTDRIRILDDFAPDGRARRITTFADGFTNAMGLILGKDGFVFLVTRSEIYRLCDTKRAGRPDEKQVIVRLETTADYPHNGLSGFAFDALGDLHFGLGENFGKPYKLIGSDGQTLTGGGEGGSIYRCRPDGTGLTRLATGFWNPFHMAFDAYGRLFAVDNDPDSRGPCRLLHIVPGGDYGYRFRYGRKGIHPFQAWNGELPGTLPMVAGTAEAPSGIVAYESDGLPAEYRGRLLVTSWGDHVIEQFQLMPRGASFTAEAKTLVRGGEDFRPVGIAIAPDGSVVVSDWVDKSYPVHGQGRVWRLRSKDTPVRAGFRFVDLEKEKLSDVVRRALEREKLSFLLQHARREVRQEAAETLAQKPNVDGVSPLFRELAGASNPVVELHLLWASVLLPVQERRVLLLTPLRSDSADVRGEAVNLLDRLLPNGGASPFQIMLAELAAQDASPYVRMSALMQLRRSRYLEPLVPVLADVDPFLVHAALMAFGRPGNSALLLSKLPTADARLRVGILLALRRAGEDAGRQALPRFLSDADPGVRRAAIQWVAEEGLREYAPKLTEAAARPLVQREVFEALLAAQDLLAQQGPPRDPNKETSGEALVAKIVHDPKQPVAFRALALRMLRPEHPALSANQLRQLANDPDADLRFEAVRSLAARSDGASQAVLRELAANGSTELRLRTEAILGLGHTAASNSGSRRLLLELLDVPELRRDSLGSLRDAVGPEEEKRLHAWLSKLAAADRAKLADQVHFLLPALDVKHNRPASVAAWQAALRSGRGDAAAGERVFFHPRGPRCYSCHRIDGRGEMLGPELSRIGAALSRDKLMESILEPSKEIAPAFTSWVIVTRDGKTRTGTIVDVGFDSTLTVADAQGKREVIRRLDIEERVASPISIMPADLPTRMTPQEFRDLLAFLEGRK